MTILTLCAGMMVYYVMQRQAEVFLSRGLEQSLKVRVEHLITTIHSEIAKTTTIVTRPVLIKQMRAININNKNRVALAIFESAARTFLPEGFAAVSFYDRKGAEVAGAGSFSSNPELEITLPLSTHAILLRDKTIVLHVDADMLDGGEHIGRVSTEAKLPSIENLLSENNSLGETSEVALCAPSRQDMVCFNTALTPHAFRQELRMQSGKPLPMSLALDGLNGVVTTRDYRNRKVVAAYSPVDELGLGMVLKIDTKELYQPLHLRIEFVLLLLFMLLLGGIFLLRWQLTPLVKRLVRSEHEARESYNHLLASNAHIRVLTEVSPVGIFRTDENGNCIYVNDRYCEIAGLSLQKALVEGWVYAIHPEDRQRVIDAWNDALRDKQPFTIECRYRQPNGDVVWILVQTTRELNDSGKVKGYIGSITDITERRRAEEALKVSEERYRSIVTVMVEGILIEQADKTIAACNPSAERILGLRKDQLIGRSLSDSAWRAIQKNGTPFPNETHPAVLTLQSGQPQANVIMGVYRPNGSLVWISINTQPLIRLGEQRPYAVVVSFIDITDQHRSEIALKSSEERYRTIVELAQEGIWQIDADGCTTFVNRKMVDMLGYTLAEMQGQSIFMFMDEKGKKIAEKNIERRRRGLIEEHEFKFIRKDGSEVWTLLSSNPLFDDQGHYRGSFAMVTDITERKHWETVLIESEKNFRALVENANMGILLHYQGKHEFANSKLLQMLGYTLEGFRNTTMKDIVYPDEYEKVSSHFLARMRGEVVPSTYETVLQTHSGTPIAVELTSTKTVWQGKPAGIVFIQDITDRQRAM